MSDSRPTIKYLQVFEHQWIRRLSASNSPGIPLEDDLFESLAAFDEDRIGRRREEQPVFQLTQRTLKPTSFVGVIQIPGLRLEILPKVERTSDSQGTFTEARQRLFQMLVEAGAVPFRHVGQANLQHEQHDLLEVYIALFGTELIRQLQQGVDAGYQRRTDNLPFWKGKLNASRHILLNAAHAERFLVSYDLFNVDTSLNRVLLHVSNYLAGYSKNPSSQRRFLEVAMRLDGCTAISRQQARVEAENVILNRTTERFRELLDFAKLILADTTPTSSAGTRQSFSLLFDMNKVFEQYIARTMYRYLEPPKLKPRFRIQAVNARRYLILKSQANNSKNKLLLQPDILFQSARGGPNGCIIIDTKWKLIEKDDGPSKSDLYQLYGYATRYQAKRVVLLYPTLEHSQVEPYWVPFMNGSSEDGCELLVKQVVLHCSDHGLDSRAIAEELLPLLSVNKMNAEATPDSLDMDQ